MQRLANGTDMTLVRTTTTTGDVQKTRLGHLAKVMSRHVGQLFILAHLVGQTRVGMEAQGHGNTLGQLFGKSA